jgi:hypothetical protein
VCLCVCVCVWERERERERESEREIYCEVDECGGEIKHLHLVLIGEYRACQYICEIVCVCVCALLVSEWSCVFCSLVHLSWCWKERTLTGQTSVRAPVFKGRQTEWSSFADVQGSGGGGGGLGFWKRGKTSSREVRAHTLNRRFESSTFCLFLLDWLFCLRSVGYSDSILNILFFLDTFYSFVGLSWIYLVLTSSTLLHSWTTQPLVIKNNSSYELNKR